MNIGRLDSAMTNNMYSFGKKSVVDNNVDFEIKASENAKIRENKGLSVLEVYNREMKKIPDMDKRYMSVKTNNYEIKVSEADGCLRIFDKTGNQMGTFSYEDINIKKDVETGIELLVSEHGSMFYDAVVVNDELKNALKECVGNEKIDIKELQGFYIKTHQGTGIKVLQKDGEEGRGGKTLICSEADQKAFDRLVDEYNTKYSNLISDRGSAVMYADFEIRGLAQHTPNGILTMGFDGVNYNDNYDYKKDWSIHFARSLDGYNHIMEWLNTTKSNMLEMEQFKSWIEVLDEVGDYERIWSKEELEQGYLNN